MSPEPNDNQDQFNNRTNVSPSGSMDDQTTFQPITSTPTASPIVTPTPNPVPSTSELISEPVFNQPPQTITPNPFPAPSTSEPQSYAPDTKPSGFSKFLKNKKLVIGIIVAILVVAIFGGSSYAYVSYYQNPQKVIADSLINVITAKTAIYTGKFEYENKSENYNVKSTVEITAKQANSATGSLNAKFKVTVEGKTIEASGDALVDSKGDVYFRISGLAKIVDEAKTTYGDLLDATTNSAIDKLVQKIDNTWIKISTDDIAAYSKEYSTTKQCINDTAEKFKNDKTAINEVTELYQKNPFIVVKKELGQKDGSFGYEINYAEKIGINFGKGLEKTKIYKELNKCDSNTFSIADEASNDSSYDSSGIDSENSTTNIITYNLWVDVWSHQITKFEVSAKSSNKYSSDTQIGSFIIKPEYNKKVTIDTPSKSITLTELKTYIEELTKSIYPSYELNNLDSINVIRKSDVDTIISAVYQYSIDNKGIMIGSNIPVAPAQAIEICTSTIASTCLKAGLADLSLLISDQTYLTTIPVDPAGNASNGAGYLIQKTINGRITVTAPAVGEYSAYSITK